MVLDIKCAPINSQRSYLLEAGAVALHVAAMHLQNLLWPAAHPSAERLDRGAVDAPLSHSELSQVGSRVAGQSLAVLKEEAAQLAAGIWEVEEGSFTEKKHLKWNINQ